MPPIKKFVTTLGPPDFVQVLPIDAIAAVSGVNYRSVQSVLAGIQAVHRVTDVPLEDLVSLQDLPPPPDFQSADPAEVARVRETKLFADYVLRGVRTQEELVSLLRRKGREVSRGGD